MKNINYCVAVLFLVLLGATTYADNAENSPWGIQIGEAPTPWLRKMMQATEFENEYFITQVGRGELSADRRRWIPPVRVYMRVLPVSGLVYQVAGESHFRDELGCKNIIDLADRRINSKPHSGTVNRNPDFETIRGDLTFIGKCQPINGGYWYAQSITADTDMKASAEKEAPRAFSLPSWLPLWEK